MWSWYASQILPQQHGHTGPPSLTSRTTWAAVWRAVAAIKDRGAGFIRAISDVNDPPAGKAEQQDAMLLARNVSVVPIDALAPLVALLRLDRQRRDRTSLQTAQRYRLAGLFAIAVGAVVDARERGVDLGDQL